MKAKLNLTIAVFLLQVIMTNAQHDAPRFEWAIHAGPNWSIAENVGAKDYQGYNVYRRTIGHGFGVNCSYNISDRLEAKMMVHYSMDKISYRYANITSTTGSGKLQVPLQIHYRLGNKVRPWSVLAGLNCSIESKSEFGKMTVPGDTLRRTAYGHGGIFPIAQLGVSKSWYNRSNRKLELMLVLNKGFKPILNFHLESPHKVTAFDYQGTRIDFMFLWYFRKKQP